MFIAITLYMSLWKVHFIYCWYNLDTLDHHLLNLYINMHKNLFSLDYIVTEENIDKTKYSLSYDNTQKTVPAQYILNNMAPSTYNSTY